MVLQYGPADVAYHKFQLVGNGFVALLYSNRTTFELDVVDSILNLKIVVLVLDNNIEWSNVR